MRRLGPLLGAAAAALLAPLGNPQPHPSTLGPNHNARGAGPRKRR